MINIEIKPHLPGMPGIACMPLYKNVPEPSNPAWKLTTCPRCGRECWASPMLEALKAMGNEVACTECALRDGMRKSEDS